MTCKNWTEERLGKLYQEKSLQITPNIEITEKDGLNRKISELKKYEILIEVVNDIEFKTAICQMEGEIHKVTVTDYLTNSESIYYYGKWVKVPVVLVQTGKKTGSHFQYGSWFETKKALYYMPQIKYVIGVGVCGAVTDKDAERIAPRVPLGHVVVSTHIVGYDHQRKGEHDENRSFSTDLSQSKFFRFLEQTEIKVEWEKEIKFGRVLSGSWLVADLRAQESVLTPTRKDEVAFEMEGVGIAAACTNVKTVECCLVVKGVSDYANRDKDDIWQPAAAKNATRYLSDMINKKVVLLLYF